MAEFMLKFLKFRTKLYRSSHRLESTTKAKVFKKHFYGTKVDKQQKCYHFWYSCESTYA